MKLWYSASTGGFYDADLHSHIPEDSVEITARRHQELLDAQADGATIVPDAETGRPRIVRPRSSVDQQKAELVRAVKQEASRRIEALSPLWRQLNDLREPGEAAARRFAAIDAIRAASNTIEAEIATTSAADLATFEIAGHAGWPASDASDQGQEPA